MIAAIYARKSTEQHGVNEEEKSVARQVAHAKEYAHKKGWTVSPDHIYIDDGMSGVNFVSRPGFIRLMNALKPRPPFDILIMSEESRLGRESIETAYSLKTITDAGVRVFFYLEDRERKLDSAMDKVMFSLASFGAEVEREKCRQRTHDAMRRKAERKEVIGCPVYGYDAVPVEDSSGNGNPHMIRQINAVESWVILRLFEQYASGTCGFVALAKQLNAEGVPPPRGHSMGWAPTCIREILRRELYRGVLVWNKTQAIVRGGKETFRKRPESEWLRIDAPKLRIVPEELWTRCSEQIHRRSAQYLRHADGRLYGHPSGADIQSRYLLRRDRSVWRLWGFLGRVAPREGRWASQLYVPHSRGGAKCSNAQRINQLVLDRVLLNGITGLLDTRILVDAVTRAAAQLRADHGGAASATSCPGARDQSRRKPFAAPGECCSNRQGNRGGLCRTGERRGKKEGLDRAARESHHIASVGGIGQHSP